MKVIDDPSQSNIIKKRNEIIDRCRGIVVGSERGITGAKRCLATIFNIADENQEVAPDIFVNEKNVIIPALLNLYQSIFSMLEENTVWVSEISPNIFLDVSHSHEKRKGEPHNIIWETYFYFHKQKKMNPVFLEAKVSDTSVPLRFTGSSETEGEAYGSELAIAVDFFPEQFSIKPEAVKEF